MLKTLSTFHILYFMLLISNNKVIICYMNKTGWPAAQAGNCVPRLYSYAYTSGMESTVLWSPRWFINFMNIFFYYNPTDKVFRLIYLRTYLDRYYGKIFNLLYDTVCSNPDIDLPPRKQMYSETY